MALTEALLHNPVPSDVYPCCPPTAVLLHYNLTQVPLCVLVLAAAHLNTMDVGATHAAAAVHEEQQLSGGLVQLQRFTQQVRTEVEHQDGAAQNVLVVPLPHKLQLQVEHENGSF